MNFFKTSLLLAAMTGLFLAIGFLIGGQFGVIIAFVIALGMNIFSYWNSDKAVLRMHNAQEVDADTAPEYYNIVRQLADNAQLPMPRVYIMHEDQPNAFATGRNPEHAAVAATSGLLRALSQEEIAGVMAHELAHIKNRDTLIMTITATIAGAISMIANFAMFFGGNRNNPLGIIGTIALMILAPLGAMIVQMAISRTREYAADRMGSEICGKPLWLASALTRMQDSAEEIENHAAEDNPATAHMFIINPLMSGGLASLFSTHPDTEKRVAALEDLAQEWGMFDKEWDTTGQQQRAPSQTSVPSTKPASSGPWEAQPKKGPWQ